MIVVEVTVEVIMILWADGGGGMVVPLVFSIQINTVPVWYVAFASKGHKT